MNKISYAITCLTLISFNATAVELPLGQANLPPCSSANWDSNARYGYSAPNRSQIAQSVTVKLIVEGENIGDARVKGQLSMCASQVAKSIDLQLLAAEPTAGNELFRRLFFQCLSVQQPLPSRIYFAALKLEGYCGRSP